MLTTSEKAIGLKRASIFSEILDETLVAVASILEQVSFGIVPVLSKHLRARLKDLAELYPRFGITENV